MVFKSKTNEGAIFSETSKSIPLRKCNKTEGFPTHYKDRALVMNCFDPLQLPKDERSLNGDYYTPNFNYFQLQLVRCVNLTSSELASMTMNTLEQKELNLALDEIAKIETESQALNQSKSFSLY